MSLYKESLLSNELRVITNEDPMFPIMDIVLSVKAGYRYESGGQKGYAHLLEHMLFEGTSKRPSPEAVGVEVDKIGGYMNAGTSQENVDFEVEASADHLEPMIELLSDMLLNPLLGRESLAKEKRVIMEELQKKEENQDDFLWRFTQKKFFQNHPLSKNILDTREDTLNATADSLTKYQHDFYGPNRAALIITGAVNHEQAMSLAEKYFGAWKPAGVSRDDLRSPTPATEKYHFFKQDRKQTYFNLCYYAPAAEREREVLALSFVANYLGFGHTALLKQELRNKYGLIYSAGARIISYRDGGIFRINTYTTKPTEALAKMKALMEGLSDRITPEVVEEIRTRLLGIFLRRFSSLYNRAQFLASGFISYNKLVTPDQMIDEIKKISHTDVINTINKYLQPENSMVVAVGPEEINS